MAGISCAFHLNRAGYRTVLLERDEIGSGASGASSGVLYYGSGTNFVPATKLFGDARAGMLWQETEGAIEEIVKMVHDDQIECGLRRPGQ